MREFIKEIMERNGMGDSWCEEKFEESYLTFDADGSGQIEAEEFTAFVKRFADL
jgi:Ca2+-binding EF-hand superfamily protein